MKFLVLKFRMLHGHEEILKQLSQNPVIKELEIGKLCGKCQRVAGKLCSCEWMCEI